MNKQQLEDKDFKALLELELFDIVGVSKESDKKQLEYTKKIGELVWINFLSSNREQLNQQDIEDITNSPKNNNYNDIIVVLEKRFPDLKDKVIASALQTKLIIIAHYIEKLRFILEEQDFEDRNELLEKLRTISSLVQAQKWEEFSKNTNVLSVIRKSIHDRNRVNTK